jgi:lambda repressor-like predicted transcriptional regulator
MEERTPPTINDRLVTELSGPAKIAALLKAHGYTFQRLAHEHGFWPTQVKLCVYGDRPYPAIREVLAQVLDLPREEIDHLLERAPPTEEAA